MIIVDLSATAVADMAVYEKETGLLLGVVGLELAKNHPKQIRLPLRNTSHWGCQFDGEERFVEGSKITHGIDAPIARYVLADVSEMYFNGGRIKRRALFMSYADWRSYVDAESHTAARDGKGGV